MKTLKYKFKLEGLDSPAGTISIRALSGLLEQFTHGPVRLQNGLKRPRTLFLRD
jgi:hypothetical protein